MSLSAGAVELFAVGKIIGCFGLKGYLKVEPYTSSLQRVLDLRDIFIGMSTEDARASRVEDVILRGRVTIVKVERVDDRSLAEQLIGCLMFVEQRDVAVLQHGTYFIHDIIGCAVSTPAGTHLGWIDDVYKLPAQDVWVVRNGEKFNFIPAVKEFIESVDLKKKQVVLRVIDGLIEE